MKIMGISYLKIKIIYFLFKKLRFFNLYIFPFGQIRHHIFPERASSKKSQVLNNKIKKKVLTLLV